MKTGIALFSCILLFGCATSAVRPPLATDAVIEAAQGAPLIPYAVSGGWNEPFAPFNVIGNIYYVGTEEIGAFLITSPSGHILLDGVLAQTVPQIIANIQALGFDVGDVKYLLNSHAHIDHAAGLAGLQRASGAEMIASAADREILEAGAISYGPTAGVQFPPIRVDRIVADGDQVALGGVVMTAHLTPGHTPGCTSWSMPVTGADGAPHTAFFHCSATVAGQSLSPEAYPGIVADFRSTFARVRGLQADVFLGNHAGFFDLEAKRERQIAGDANAFVDPPALQAFNSELEEAFEAALTRQQATAQ